jgi:hypothetical protein
MLKLITVEPEETYLTKEQLVKTRDPAFSKQSAAAIIEKLGTPCSQSI